MKHFHYLTVEVFVHATEERESVVEAVKNIFDEETFERMSLEETHAEGYHKNPIIILRWTLKGSGRVGRVLKGLIESIGRELEDELEERVDDEGTLHIRLDKMDAYRGIISLARGEEPIVLKFKLASYPSGREGAIKTLREYLKR
ncbi:MAG: hypothetical protein DRJ64_08925 [Thermoprotei archaeon]|nr:MAG: hypothetical protein DRJ64_08925 [Thermoprotei archaeon]